MVGNSLVGLGLVATAFNGKPLSAGPLFGRTIDVMAVNHVPSSSSMLATTTIVYCTHSVHDGTLYLQ